MLDDTSCLVNMESPQMYDLNDAVVKADFAALSGSLSVKSNKLGGVYGDDFGELTDLGASEVSLDLQSFVADQQFSDAIFSDIIDQRSSLLNGGANGLGGPPGLRPALPPVSTCGGINYNSYLPPAAPCSVQRSTNLSGLALKKEPDSTVFSPCRPSNPPGLTSVTTGATGYQGSLGGVYSPPYGVQSTTGPGCALGSARGLQQPSALGARVSSKHVPTSSTNKRQDRSTDEYRRRRERNNVAVRKSREKAKLRTMETEERVKYLSRENEGLQKRIEMLSKELNVLKNLFANVGMLPDQLQREINKHLLPPTSGGGSTAGGVLPGAALL